VADRRLRPEDGLAGEVQHQAQHAVGGGVLWAHVEGQLAELPLDDGDAHGLYPHGVSIGKSLRSGCPAYSSGSRMRRRSGWPAKRTPKRSYTSRSFQSAPDQTSTSESIVRSSL